MCVQAANRITVFFNQRQNTRRDGIKSRGKKVKDIEKRRAGGRFRFGIVVSGGLYISYPLHISVKVNNWLTVNQKKI